MALSVPKLKNTKLAVGMGCSTLALLVVGPIVAFFVFSMGFHHFIFVFGEPVVALSQDETSFDPIKEKDHVLHLAGPQFGFLSMNATGVRRDGTMDLTSKIVRSRATYEFAGREPSNADVPLGVSRHTEEVTIDAYPKGKRLRKIVGAERFYSHEIGLRKEFSKGGPGRYRPRPFPACSFRILWDHAVERGTPESAVAQIEYKDGKYMFWVIDTEYRHEFDQTCNPTKL